MRHSCNNKNRGFTLIELMIVVAIIGILAAIVYPSYLEQLQASRRSDAKIVLLDIMNRQDVFKSNFGVYTTVIVAPSVCTGSVCGLNLASAISKDGYYTVTAANGPTGAVASSVTLTAARVAGGAQATDGCASLSLTSTGVKGITNYDGTGSITGSSTNDKGYTADSCW